MEGLLSMQQRRQQSASVIRLKLTVVIYNGRCMGPLHAHHHHRHTYKLQLPAFMLNTASTSVTLFDFYGVKRLAEASIRTGSTLQPSSTCCIANFRGCARLVIAQAQPCAPA